MPARGKSWSPRVRQRAVFLWRNGSTRKEIVAALPRWIDEQHIDTDGRVPTMTNVIDWTSGVGRDGEPWDFTRATPEEVELVAPIYAAAVAAGEARPWPSLEEAGWWVRIRTLLEGFPEMRTFEMGRYAAGVDEAEQRDIARSLMLYSQQPKRSVARVINDETPMMVGGTAIVDMERGRR